MEETQKRIDALPSFLLVANYDERANGLRYLLVGGKR